MGPNVPSQLRIPVVDDDELVCDTVKMLLDFDGHVVETARSGKRALEIFQAGKFDVVITDQLMAGMKGNELAAAIKALVPEQPVIMLTGHAQTLQADKNVNGIVSKPCTIQDLRKALVAALRPREG